MAAIESECVRGLLAAVTDWVGDGRGRAEGGEGRQEEALYCAVLCCTVPLRKRKSTAGQGTSGGTITIAGGDGAGQASVTGASWCLLSSPRSVGADNAPFASTRQW